MLYQLMRLTEAVPGDTAECGVYKGTSSYLICRVNQEAENYNRLHFGFDSFEGLSEPTGLDGTYWKKHDNYGLKHWKERLNIYLKEKFDYDYNLIPLS